MEISHIVKNQKVIKYIGDFENLNIESLASDTKNVTENSMFFCLNGSVSDGHNFAVEAKEKGAVVLVVERPLDVDISQIVVENSRSAMSVMAGNFFGNPREKLKLVGVTGTNGKTTTTYMIESILKTAGFKVGVVGTIGIVIDDINLPASLTTPDPIELHSVFAQMVNKNVDYVVMEVSAHAIKLDKMAGIKCDVGILTNITEDHLDYFKTFENYKNTKLDFLTSKFCDNVVVNSDDFYGKKFVLDNEGNNSLKIFSYGLKNPSDVFAVDYNFSLSGTHYFLNLFDEVKKVETKMTGEFNLYNALCSATACKVLGISTKDIIKGLSDMMPVAGRFNIIDLAENGSVILDYAHTPDGLKNILTSTRQITSGKVISLFGCGGNRDAIKRPIMGKISASIADFTIITSDNPRLEEPEKIIAEIENGAREISKNYLCIENRVEAIRYALTLIKKGDALVISGKGAENYLDIGGVKYPYSDLETIKTESQKQKKEPFLRC